MLSENEPLLRFVAFAGVLAALAGWEVFAPRRRREMPRAWRWPGNLGVVVIDTLLVRLLFPTAVVGLAVLGEERNWGLFQVLEWPAWVTVPLAFLAMDLAIYLQHVMFHAVPALWRLHRMHHADTGFDVSTGLRFHPLEILLSMVWKAAVVVALGPPVLAVLAFEIVLNAGAMFSHSNIRLAPRLDGMLRKLIVTPDMHRVHHSSRRRETDSNYGFNFACWDRLFGTYVAAPEGGHRRMQIGLAAWRGSGPERLIWALLLPFRRS